MKKWILVILLIGVFVFSKVNVFAVEGSCGGPDEPCCFDDGIGKFSCSNCDTCTCVKRGSKRVCISTTTPNTCMCNGDGIGSLYLHCDVKQITNFCDYSEGKEAYCIYEKPTSNSPLVGTQCGQKLTGDYTCKCATPQEAQNDNQLNGYNRYYITDTCKVGFIANNYYVDQNYCSNEKSAKLFWCQVDTEGIIPQKAAKCYCVTKNFPEDGHYGDCDSIPASRIASKSTNGMSNINEEYLFGSTQKLYCENVGDNENPYIRTALGCIPISVKGFIGWIVPTLFGIIGGIAFLIMIYGFIMMSTSEGDPKKAAAAKETITAAITGLILSIFAIFLVRLIMLYILKLPGVK